MMLTLPFVELKNYSLEDSGDRNLEEVQLRSK